MSATAVIIVVLVAVLAALVAAFLLVGRGGGHLKLDIGSSTPQAAAGTGSTSETSFKSRLKWLNAFPAAVFVALFGKLWSMQVLGADDYAKQAESNRTRTISVEAPRGRILDRNGTELVTNRPSLTVVATSDVADDTIKVHLLANLIGMPAMAVRRKVQDTSQGAQSSRVVAVDVSRRVVAYIDARATVFDGVSVEQRTQRLYPQGSLAAHVLGYTGSITQDQADQLDSSDSAAINYELGDVVGQSGVEYQYESVLQGVKGEQKVYVDADGNILSLASEVEPQRGSDVVLTLDADIQQAAETSLQERIKKLYDEGRTDCHAGCVVAMDVTNGEVLCMASAPTYQPNVFVGGISNDDWDSLSSDSSHYPLMNRAVSGQYPSASTIKPLSALAALDYGIATASSSYDCTGYWTGFGSSSGQWCWQHSGHGWLGLQGGITYSCDVVFYEIGKGFYNSSTQDGLQETYRKWGLGSTEGIDLPSEATGRVPDAEWKWNYYTSSSDEDRQWKGGDYTNLVIGQGDLQVTPLQMLCTYAGIATSGTIWRPHVLKAIKSPVGTGSVVDYKCEVARSVEENPSYMDLVHAGLLGVVYEESEAQAEHFTNLSVKVAGKTGSAETSKSQPTGWFIAYAPADDPKYVVASLIEYGGYGSEGAMFVVRDVLGAIYGEPDTSTAVDSSGVR